MPMSGRFDAKLLSCSPTIKQAGVSSFKPSSSSVSTGLIVQPASNLALNSLARMESSNISSMFIFLAWSCRNGSARAYRRCCILFTPALVLPYWSRMRSSAVNSLLRYPFSRRISRPEILMNNAVSHCSVGSLVGRSVSISGAFGHGVWGYGRSPGFDPVGGAVF